MNNTTKQYIISPIIGGVLVISMNSYLLHQYSYRHGFEGATFSSGLVALKLVSWFITGFMIVILSNLFANLLSKEKQSVKEKG